MSIAFVLVERLLDFEQLPAVAFERLGFLGNLMSVTIVAGCMTRAGATSREMIFELRVTSAASAALRMTGGITEKFTASFAYDAFQHHLCNLAH